MIINYMNKNINAYTTNVKKNPNKVFYTHLLVQ